MQIIMQITEAFKGKTLVITGGTGSFGSTVLKHFLTTDIGEIRIISRDEKKQDWMRHTLQAQYPEYCGKVQFYVGDVQEWSKIKDSLLGWYIKPWVRIEPYPTPNQIDQELSY